ncbi:hypothetical protein EMCG_00176 [[Emmonsia] crescens]|uniref:Uncharacterized protein n=1 Tax=[Emmonsia] crescens TaxID=73230 RepID=A0A0G2ICN9_9EURO|nr:hypothetical protein EMCG_00176 [Emmonsia crescens UAMH 3008]
MKCPIPAPRGPRVLSKGRPKLFWEASVPIHRKRAVYSAKKITYSAAKERKVNILNRLGYHDQQTLFFNQLNDNCDWIKIVVTHHLGLGARSVESCRVGEVEH